MVGLQENNLVEQGAPKRDDNTNYILAKMDIEFDITVTVRYLDKVKKGKTAEEIRKIIEDHKAIVEEIVETEKHEHTRYKSFLHDDVAYRVADRLSDYCYDEPLTETYCAKIIKAFWIEKDVILKYFKEVLPNKGDLERRLLMSNLTLIKSYVIKEAEAAKIDLSERKLHSISVRLSKFMFFTSALNIIPSKDLPLHPDDDNPPPHN
ncbi:gamete antigen 27/25, putative [Plasmodium gallinaceum]|uniref:Gamete antigen 27/25, putative n=1 Tax=Plasmodium gallinaceum TaxID=5849 RepID=A0A1J1GTN7_PLAGA|nr:gamete antigen 27/25, putative [Plasmodium gallinaceum]CRG94411.1 gamete antigen 27/25, putative [Plasmodium gallinaceum]